MEDEKNEIKEILEFYESNEKIFVAFLIFSLISIFLFAFHEIMGGFIALSLVCFIASTNYYSWRYCKDFIDSVFDRTFNFIALLVLALACGILSFAIGNIRPGLIIFLFLSLPYTASFEKSSDLEEFKLIEYTQEFVHILVESSLYLLLFGVACVLVFFVPLLAVLFFGLVYFPLLYVDYVAKIEGY